MKKTQTLTRIAMPSPYTGYRETAMTDHLIQCNTRPVTVIGHTDLDWDLVIKASISFLAALVIMVVVL